MIQFEAVTIRSLTIPAGIFRNIQVAGLPLGPVGLALGAALGAWIEWALLRASLQKRIGVVGTGASQLAKMFGSAIVAAAAGYGVRVAAAGYHPVLVATFVVAAFGVVYFGVARALGLAEARVVMDSALRRLGRRRAP
jgi:putative peptidoglycan lipid II flippase